MKFENLKNDYHYPQVPVVKRRYWNKMRCSLLAQNFYLLDTIELRKLFGGRSYSTIRAKAYELIRSGWEFEKC